MPPKSRGPNKSIQKHTKSSKNQSTSDHAFNAKDGGATKDSVPLALQQKLLNIFRNAFPSRFEPGLSTLLQEVKGLLYHRDFIQAFERDDYREAYAVRWSPSRTLGYLEIFEEVVDGIWDAKDRDESEKESGEDEGSENEIKIICLGGGAGAEMVSLAGLLNMLQQRRNSDENAKIPDKSPIKVQRQAPCLNVDFVDIANWAPILDRLYENITTPPALSPYASTAAKASNISLIPASILSFTFHQHDILKLHLRELHPLVGDQDLVTLFFTLNELYTTSPSLTQTFLLNLTWCTKVGTILLVVDSAGNYSEVGLGKEEVKKYPMQWLLDHTLLKSATEVDFSHPVDESFAEKKHVLKWEKLKGEESRWFRLSDGLKYPLELENMRYQVHLYRRIA
jgi:25S rRNA (uracil2843-N3)-methyltransferase